MRRFCINCLIFLLIVAACDFAIGQGLSYWRTNKSEGFVGNVEYSYRRSTDDVMVLGASRATFHYVPDIIADSLGLSCCNCGRYGMGILYTYGRWRMMKSHHIPKLILYDVTANDYDRKEENARFINDLKPYYDCDGMKELFEDVDSMEKFKVQSLLYRNNSKLLDIFVGHMMADEMKKGYIPLHGTLGKHYLKKDTPHSICALKMKYMEKFIQETQKDHVTVIFLISPYYVHDFATFPDELKILFDKYHVAYFDYSNMEGISGHPDKFIITKHMNDIGAREYTRRIIPQVRKVLRDAGIECRGASQQQATI